MISLRHVASGATALAVILLGSWAGPSPAIAGEVDAKPKTQVEVQLTESFYRALSGETGKTYTTSASDDYLRQIAVSTRFMVETNLRIIEQQARIIELLETTHPGSGN